MNQFPDDDDKMSNNSLNKEARLSKEYSLPNSYLQQKRKNSNSSSNDVNEEKVELEKEFEFEKGKIEYQESIKNKIENENNHNSSNQNISETEIIDLNSSQDNKNDQKKVKDNNNTMINNNADISNNIHHKIEKMTQTDKEKDVKNENSIYSSKDANNSKQKNEENNNNLINEDLKNNNLNDNKNYKNSTSKKSSKSTNSKEKIKDIGKEKAQQGLEDLKIEKNKDIKFIDNIGYVFDIFICGLRVQMGPFISQKKAECVMRYIKLNESILTSMSKEIRKDWLKNLSIMIEDLTD